MRVATGKHGSRPTSMNPPLPSTTYSRGKKSTTRQSVATWFKWQRSNTNLYSALFLTTTGEVLQQFSQHQHQHHHHYHRLRKASTTPAATTTATAATATTATATTATGLATTAATNTTTTSTAATSTAETSTYLVLGTAEAMTA